MIDFGNTLVFLGFLIGGIFLLAGTIMLKFPPKKINSLYGYRTKSSMSTQEKWDFAQKYSSLLMIKLAAIYILLMISLSFFNFKELINTIIGLGGMIMMVFVLVYFTEKQLKKI